MIRALSYLFSVITHPLWIMLYVLLIYIWVNPYLFPFFQERQQGALILNVFFTTVLFPALITLLFWKTELISSIQMHDKKERIGPLIATMILYLWLYLNFRTNSTIPIMYSNFMLGALISLFVAFFINLFEKISLHAVGLGALWINTIAVVISHGSTYVQLGDFNIHNLLLIIGLTLIVGFGLTSRLILKAHNIHEIRHGFWIGMFGQIVAVIFIL